LLSFLGENISKLITLAPDFLAGRHIGKRRNRLGGNAPFFSRRDFLLLRGMNPHDFILKNPSLLFRFPSPSG
jgi:hypothetical protein